MSIERPAPGGFGFVCGRTVTGGSDEVEATKAGDLWTIEVDDNEHDQVSDSVISGG
jgi:hypothetical protein